MLRSLPNKALHALQSGPVMIVDTGAIRRNFTKLSEMSEGACAAVVKGDACGHGMRQAVGALFDGGARLFFAARFDDALTIRADLGEGPRIAVFDGLAPAILPDAAACGIVPVVNSLSQLQAAADFAKSGDQKLSIFVHIDTAMNRIGLGAEEIERARPLLETLDILAYMTHFVAVDDVDIGLCRLQVVRLKSLCQTLPKAPLSIANSCSVYLGKEFHGDIIRPGKSTFGINPLPEGQDPLEEPATVLAPVVQLRSLGKGEPVGYSSTWHAPDDRQIAILAIGYANGYKRANSKKGSVAFEGHLAPVVGRVSMDLTAVDVTALPSGLVAEGDVGEMVGPHLTYRDLAKLAGTNEHENLIALVQGCRRVHVETP